VIQPESPDRPIVSALKPLLAATRRVSVPVLGAAAHRGRPQGRLLARRC
jgi:hypothetical protein